MFTFDEKIQIFMLLGGNGEKNFTLQKHGIKDGPTVLTTIISNFLNKT